MPLAGKRKYAGASLTSPLSGFATFKWVTTCKRKCRVRVFIFLILSQMFPSLLPFLLVAKHQKETHFLTVMLFWARGSYLFLVGVPRTRRLADIFTNTLLQRIINRADGLPSQFTGLFFVLFAQCTTFIDLNMRTTYCP